jgi:hypothetical protein
VPAAGTDDEPGAAGRIDTELMPVGIFAAARLEIS